MKNTAISKDLKKVKTGGIKELLKGAGAMRIAEFSMRYDQLSAQQFRPKIRVANYNKLRRAGTAKVWIDGYPLPEIDYYAGHFLPPGRSRPKKPIYACWRTSGGQRIQTLEHRKDNLYTVGIPEDAVDGILAFLLPMVEHFGPAKMTEKFPADIKNWIGLTADHSSSGKITITDIMPV